MNIDNPGITDEAKKMSRDHSWPGNFRELANTIKKAFILAGVISAQS